MTLENTAWAIDGALLNSSLARRAEYAAISGAQGIVQQNDLKVTQLDVPGVGVQISAGVGLVTNNYQDNPNETYVVSNPGVHVIPSGSMPAANPAPKSYIVAVVVGDPDFSQTGHPWMPSVVPPGEETTFEYVRATIIEVTAGATTLPLDYPGLPLARLDVPASTTTITDAMIVDLRALARPRQWNEIFASPAGTWTNASPVLMPSAAAYAEWGQVAYTPSVKVPTWAKRAVVVANINGVVLTDTSVNIAGGIRTKLGSTAGTASNFDVPTSSGSIRDNLMTASSYDVTAVAGTTVTLKIEAWESTPASPTANQTFKLQSGSQMIFDVRFFEE